MRDEEKWAQPQEVNDIELAFPANALEFMPERDDIPDEFREGDSSWVDFQKHWFFNGLGQPSFYMKKGVDGEKALRHLSAIQGSYAPKHEHKEEAVAYLASRWFEAVVLEDGTIFGEDVDAIRKALAAR